MIDWDEGDLVFVCDGKGCSRWLKPNKEKLMSCYEVIIRNGWWISPGTPAIMRLHLCPKCNRTNGH